MNRIASMCLLWVRYMCQRGDISGVFISRPFLCVVLRVTFFLSGGGQQGYYKRPQRRFSLKFSHHRALLQLMISFFLDNDFRLFSSSNDFILFQIIAPIIRQISSGTHHYKRALTFIFTWKGPNQPNNILRVYKPYVLVPYFDFQGFPRM